MGSSRNDDPGQFLEVIGLPESGKHLLKKTGALALERHGWHEPTAPPQIDSRGRDIPFADCWLGRMLPEQSQRLFDDGLRLPWAASYISYSSSNLLTSRMTRLMTTGRLFLDESLLHHFGPEVADFLSTGPEQPAVDALLGRHCAVIRTIAPRVEVLQRLEARRGQPVFWDWASGYGSRLGEFLDLSESRIERLVSLLAQFGIPTVDIEVTAELGRADLSQRITEALDEVDERLRLRGVDDE